ncbi:GMC family oxidoreductase [Herbiconiux sp. VKM Ac-1786]|uniref:GMC family oxidoreductase n=1 Tax=Herbiconiux sp. VKM Ac-1786 TaxID=2783824 RepID=UPI00188C04AE|nr:GMC family oxidoreductase [Herbiconiux sp. VKM Ac-1786]MBF4573213.1 GMC family oxidoreductase [Herbiconiux sp. VKM Ac-1786]
MNLTGMKTYPETDVVDAVVIGTGAGGAPILASLAARGLSVVALEAGPNFEPGQHTPDETEAVEINWMAERLSGGTDPTAFGQNNSGRGVGGSTLHWGAFTPRPQRTDIRLKSDSGLGEDWPVDFDELTRYIERAERDIGVSGPADYPWDPARRYDYPATRRNASSDMMMSGCSALGIRATDAPAAVLTRDRHQPNAGPRQACVSCGACHQGCRTAAKASMDTTYLPAAVASGAEIRAEAMVHAIETDASGRVVAVVYRQHGVDHRQRCANVFLCAGGIETPRLLLHTGLANSSGQVGRNFMAHGGTQVWGTFDTEMRGYRGYPSSIISEDMVRPADASFAGGYLMQSLGVMPLTYATSLTRGGGLWGRGLMDALDDYAFVAGVGINGECLPAEGNRLELSSETDEFGIPKARILFSAGENEKALDEHATATMIAIVEASGATSTRVLARTAHTVGTARMGVDPGSSVVDADGRSHDVPNLWISDNSVFPSSLIANPALTIMALALRTADRFLDVARV